MELAKSCQTLICLLKALVGKCTTVELRHERSVWGQLVSVDDKMNVLLINAVVKTLEGKLFACDDVYIQGKNIRFVQIPDDFDMVKATHQWFERLHHGNKANSGTKEGRKAFKKLVAKQNRQNKLDQKVKQLQSYMQNANA